MTAPADDATLVVSEVVILLIQLTVASSNTFVGIILLPSFNSTVTFPLSAGFMVSV